MSYLHLVVSINQLTTHIFSIYFCICLLNMELRRWYCLLLLHFLAMIFEGYRLLNLYDLMYLLIYLFSLGLNRGMLFCLNLLCLLHLQIILCRFIDCRYLRFRLLLRIKIKIMIMSLTFISIFMIMSREIQSMCSKITIKSSFSS